MTTVMHAIAIQLAPTVARLLRESGINRSDMAERLGVSNSAVSMALDPGEYCTNVSLLRRIAAELGHDVTFDVTVRPARPAHTSRADVLDQQDDDSAEVCASAGRLTTDGIPAVGVAPART